VLEDMLQAWRGGGHQPDTAALGHWWKTIDHWRARRSFDYQKSD
jgi:acetolactate synthase-1/2/3 large subunit